MMVKGKYWVFVSLLFINSVIFSQETKPSWASENITFTGYIKYLNTSNFQNFDALLNDNLLHNRLNLKIYLNQSFTADLEIRNRVLWGDSVQVIPDYATGIDTDQQDIDLSFFIVDKPALLIHSKIDRFSLKFNSDKWQIVLGRQRINWGKNLVWNPNDLFNTYSFFDFDYEERPGVDALRIQYFTSGNSSIETAINYRDKWENTSMALKYNFHKFEYDFQVLLAKYLKDYVVGFGWEGAVKNMGVKGEISYFINNDSLEQSSLVASVSLDYFLKNGITLSCSGLYNENGITNSDSFNPNQFNTYQLDAKHLMPNRWSFFAQASKNISPAITTSISGIYAYDIDGFFVMPQITYSISQNWDFDTTAQLFYGKQQDTIENMFNSIYLRFRWSF